LRGRYASTPNAGYSLCKSIVKTKKKQKNFKDASNISRQSTRREKEKRNVEKRRIEVETANKGDGKARVNE